MALPSPCAGNDRRGTLRLGSPRECARPAKRPAESFAACLYLLGEDLWRSSREMISIFSYINRIVYCFDFRLDAIDSIDSMERNEFLFFSLSFSRFNFFRENCIFIYTSQRRIEESCITCSTSYYRFRTYFALESGECYYMRIIYVYWIG